MNTEQASETIFPYKIERFLEIKKSVNAKGCGYKNFKENERMISSKTLRMNFAPKKKLVNQQQVAN